MNGRGALREEFRVLRCGHSIGAQLLGGFKNPNPRAVAEGGLRELWFFCCWFDRNLWVLGFAFNPRG